MEPSLCSKTDFVADGCDEQVGKFSVPSRVTNDDCKELAPIRQARLSQALNRNGLKSLRFGGRPQPST